MEGMEQGRAEDRDGGQGQKQGREGQSRGRTGHDRDKDNGRVG